MSLFLLCFLLFIPDPPLLALVLSPGDDEQVLFTALLFSHERGWDQAPLIFAMEPGPLDLQRGLRLLPNQIPPRLQTPRILIISHSPAFQPSNIFLAFVRRCLDEGTAVIVCGPAFPDALIDGALLKPGQSISLVSLQQLSSELNRLMPLQSDPPVLPPWFMRWITP